MDEPRRRNQVTTADIASIPPEHDHAADTRDERGTWRERYEDARSRAGDVARDDRSEPHDHGEGGDPDLSRDPQGPRDVDEAARRIEQFFGGSL